MQFKPREAIIQESLANLQTSMSLMQLFPQAAIKDFEEFLRARNVKDIKGYMQQPQQMMLPEMSGSEMAPSGA